MKVMIKTNFILVGIFFVFLVGFISGVSAWDLYGYTYDVDGNVLNNTIINITLWVSAGGPPTYLGYNSTYSNETGWFNLSVEENPNWLYKPVITHFQENKTDGTTPIDYIGQTLPHLPFSHFVDTTNIDFYLGEAGTINITAVNITGGSKTFRYQVKDTLLGFPIEEEFENPVSQAIIYVPKNRNYSIMIYPEEAMPVTFNWNNFSSDLDYDISGGPSNYNATKSTLEKVFNCSDNLLRVTGYIDATDISGWDEFTVVPFLLEPGNMVYIGDNSGMPYNMSAWNGQTDEYNLTSGFYNITLPGPEESVNYVLFATARNGSGYYGGYKNITLGYSDSSRESNFTMYSLMSTDWASLNSNISLSNPTGPGTVNISSARQQFSLINSTNHYLTQSNAHVEVKVDYSDYGAIEFTFMMSLSGSSFYLPLINETGIKEINVYSKSYAPKRVGTKTPAQILSNPNITLNIFNPGDIDGNLESSDISIIIHKSNEVCNVPNPPESCDIKSDQTKENFNPLSSIIGGGKLNFRTKYNNIEVVYINVDMIASGPPDASFDSQASESAGDSFESAMRFGSGGPKIYDYVLISFPYTPGSTSQTGLNEDSDVNMTIPLLYDEDWNLIWDSSVNGTNGTFLAGNHSHYSDKSSEWETLMQNNNCTKNESKLSSTNPCYIDTTNKRIWIRLPHFSGTQPSITGNVITATPSSTDPEGSSSSGTGIPTKSEWAKQKILSFSKIVPGVASVMSDFSEDMGVREIQIDVKSEAQNAKITVRKYDSKPAEVSVEKSGKVHKYLQIETENLNDNLEKAIVNIQVNKSWISENSLNKEDIALFKFDEESNIWNELPTNYLEEDEGYFYYNVELTSFSFFAISEKVLEEQENLEDEVLEEESFEAEINDEELTEPSKKWIWFLIAGLVVLVILIIAYKKLDKKAKKK